MCHFFRKIRQNVAICRAANQYDLIVFRMIFRSKYNGRIVYGMGLPNCVGKNYILNKQYTKKTEKSIFLESQSLNVEETYIFTYSI